MRPQRLFSLLALALLVCSGIAIAFYQGWHTPAPPPPRAALPLVPAVAMQTLNGDTITTHDFSGNVVLIHFWASWCAPCVREFPQIIELLQADPTLVMIALSVDSDKGALQAFLDKLPQPSPPNLHLVWDAEKRITNDVFQTYRYPETIIVGADLTLIDKWVGEVDWLAPTTRARLDRFGDARPTPHQ